MNAARTSLLVVSMAVLGGAGVAGLGGLPPARGADQLAETHADVGIWSPALECGACHPSLGDGGPYLMDLQGELGYAPDGPIEEVCGRCHNSRTPKSFLKEHERHVWGKNFDCSWCHDFSRPERGLEVATHRLPAGDGLALGKSKVKAGRPGKDSFKVDGTFTTEDPDTDLSAFDVTLGWGGGSVLIPAGDLLRKGTKAVWAYRSPKGNLPVVSAVFDLSKRRFKVAVKRADLSGFERPFEFRVAFGAYDETVQVP